MGVSYPCHHILLRYFCPLLGALSRGDKSESRPLLFPVIKTECLPQRRGGGLMEGMKKIAFVGERTFRLLLILRLTKDSGAHRVRPYII